MRLIQWNLAITLIAFSSNAIADSGEAPTDAGVVYVKSFGGEEESPKLLEPKPILNTFADSFPIPAKAVNGTSDAAADDETVGTEVKARVGEVDDPLTPVVFDEAADAIPSAPMSQDNGAEAEASAEKVEPPSPSSGSSCDGPMDTCNATDACCKDSCFRSGDWSLFDGVFEEFSDCCGNRGVSVFADMLYFTARDVDLSYATHVSGVGALAVPLGPTAIADPDREPSVRAGVRYQLDDCGCDHLVATYWNFQSNTDNAVQLPGGTGLFRAELLHPNTSNVAADSLNASADYEINFQKVDLDYETVVYLQDSTIVKGLAGLRYARLDQDLVANYSILLRTTVNTDVDFDGIGPRLGLDFKHDIGGGFHAYGRGTANFLLGEFRADYIQSNIGVGTQAATSFRDDRLVTILDLELGLGWESCSGRWGLSTGFYVGHWGNVVSTPTYINAVQRNDLDDVNEGMTFEGFIFRAFLNF